MFLRLRARYLPLELLVIINEKSGKAKQGSSTFIMRLLIDLHRDKIIEKFGEEVYRELREKYSKDILTQKKEKLEDEEAKQAKAEEKLRQRAKALELKARELAIREANTGIRTDKFFRAKEEKEAQIEVLKTKRKELAEKLEREKRGDAITRRGLFIQRDIKKIDEKLEALGVVS